MRKLLGIVVAVSTLCLVGCTESLEDESIEASGEGVLNEPIADELDPMAVTTPDEDELIAGWCNFQNTWNSSWTTLENSVLTLVNQKRAAGATCGGVAKPPVAAVTLDSKLRCAARFHSKDMSTLNFFSHTGSNGSNFTTRMGNAGYTWTAAGENIAAGQTTAAAVVSSWMSSTGHCNNIMNGNFKHLGVGYSYSATATYKAYWTQDFGKP